jgi:hypothetical protein
MRSSGSILIPARSMLAADKRVVWKQGRLPAFF